MRVIVIEDTAVIYRFDADDDSRTTFPDDYEDRAAIIRALTAALKYLLFKKRGGLDNEV